MWVMNTALPEALVGLPYQEILTPAKDGPQNPKSLGAVFLVEGSRHPDAQIMSMVARTHCDHGQLGPENSQGHYAQFALSHRPALLTRNPHSKDSGIFTDEVGLSGLPQTSMGFCCSDGSRYRSRAPNGM
jgi:hypothetical protein